MLPNTTDVLIIGAGPTGMALSIALHQAGIDHVIVDKLAEGQNTSRAAVVHAQTLVSLERLGVAERMVELGLKLDRFAIRDRGRALLDLRFKGLPSAHPYLLMLPQNLTEKVLGERIVELGGSIQRGAVATSIVSYPDRVDVTVEENGRTATVGARYVVGADGMHSLVREAAGIGFTGAAYDGSFILADVHLDWPLADEVSLFFSPAGLVVVAPLPDGAFRIVATMQEAPPSADIALVQSLLDKRGPDHSGAVVRDVIWSSRFRLHHRIADSYRAGRLLLIGDAAHVHSPAGGQGMNTGLGDAVVLGELVADVLNGRRDEADLDLYERLRRPAAQQVLGLAGRLTRMATARNPLARLARNTLLSTVNRIPSARRRIAMALSGISRADFAKVPAARRPAKAA